MCEKISFDVDKYLEIYYEIEIYQISPGYVRSQTFKDIFINKNLLDLNNLGIPNVFRYLSGYNLCKLLKIFENIPLEENNGKINDNKKYNE